MLKWGSMTPVNYETLTQLERRHVREMYVHEQKGLCYFCKTPLNVRPARTLRINWNLFPGGEGFLRYPVHLHHSHETGMTIGAVHAYCNAVLWQYYKE